MVYTFVILHYIVEKDTVECVNSILENVTSDNDDKVNIVIVDNKSQNSSVENLMDRYKNFNNIYILLNKKNYGFAKGNNEGIRFAKYSLNSDFIAVINNDTIINQNDWIFVTKELYKNENFAVLGPDIITLDGIHQNPFIEKNWTIQLLKKERLKQYIKILLIFLGLDKFVLKDEFELKNSFKNNLYCSEMENVCLHGSCLIFSKKFIDVFDGFHEGTFLYMEEEILKLIMDQNDMKTLYSPKLQILHKEDMSTNAIRISNKKKKIRKCRFWINSSKVYEKVLKNKRR